ncbi:MAG TPA: biotin transporter BioY [Candidatus Polarisedimenticolia bacterium]|nr:biotin transporter BioY [Candidatus Polarisedimenticolia bacterium]
MARSLRIEDVAAPWGASLARKAAAPALFAALTALGGLVRVWIPGNPVPLTLQVVAVLLAGAFLRPRAAFASMALFLGAGLGGAPVFSGGGWGAAYLLGPTGGYLLGFLAAAPLVSWLLRGRSGPAAMALSMAAGVAVIHVLGVLHLAIYLGGAFAAAVSDTSVFLPMDLAKIGLAAAIGSGASSLRSRRRG